MPSSSLLLQNRAEEGKPLAKDVEARTLLENIHGIALPASATDIQNCGDATEDKPDRGLVSMFQMDTKEIPHLIRELSIFGQADPIKQAGDPTVNGWNVWPTTSKTFVPENPEYSKLKKTWVGDATPEFMVSCHSTTGDWLHLEVGRLDRDKSLVKLYTDWN